MREPEVIAHGSDRDPWRPSRRLIGLATVLAMVLAGLALGAHEVQARRADAAAAARAAHAFALDVRQDTTSLGWVLRNQSATQVSIQSAVLDFPGTTFLIDQRDLGRFGSITMKLGHEACDVGLYERGPSELVVAATTRAGLHVTRHVSLRSEDQDYLGRRLREVCRMLPPDEALQGTLVSSTRAGRSLRVTYDLRNSGVLPLSLDGVAYLPGVTVTARPSRLVLQESPPTFPIPDTRLVVELRISSCVLLEKGVRAMIGGQGLGPRGLTAHVRHAHGDGEGFLYLMEAWVPFLRSCPSVAPYLREFAAG